MKTLITVAALVLLASPVHAQEPPPSRSLRMATYAFASATAADLAITGIALSRPHVIEANPFYGGTENPALIITTGAAAGAASIFVVHRWIAPKHPKLAVVVLYAQAAVRVWAAAKGAQVLSEQPQGRR